MAMRLNIFLRRHRFIVTKNESIGICVCFSPFQSICALFIYEWELVNVRDVFIEAFDAPWGDDFMIDFNWLRAGVFVDFQRPCSVEEISRAIPKKPWN